jgi:hypothetical protein
MYRLSQISKLSRPRQRTLLKLTYRGGVLRLSTEHLVAAPGWFGTGQARRFPLQGLERIVISQPLPGANWRGLTLYCTWHDGTSLECHDIGPLVIQRLCQILRVLEPRVSIEER